MTAHEGLRAQLHAAEVSVGAWANLTDPRVAAALAGAGFDWVCIDQQHGYASGRDATDLLGAVHAAGGSALVRVPWNRPEEIGRALDAGADGVIVPMVGSAAEAGAAVDAARYAPAGRRSWGGTRGPYALRPVGAAEVNARVACVVMVETPDAVEQVAEIAAVDGVDAVFVGPFDLSIAYGRELTDLLDDRGAESPLGRVVAACRRAGVVAGAYGGTVERAAALRRHGFGMLAVTTDDGLVAEAGAAAVTRARTVLG